MRYVCAFYVLCICEVHKFGAFPRVIVVAVRLFSAKMILTCVLHVFKLPQVIGFAPV